MKNRGESATPFKVQQEIAMPPEAPTDFAVGLHLSEKHGVVFMITKARWGGLRPLSHWLRFFRLLLQPDWISNAWNFKLIGHSFKATMQRDCRVFERWGV